MPMKQNNDDRTVEISLIGDFPDLDLGTETLLVLDANI